MSLATAAALLGFAITLATGALWFRRMSAVALPANRAPFVVAMAAGAGLGIAALSGGVGWLPGVLAGFSILAGIVFATLVAISAQKGGTGLFHVGQPVPDFTARDDSGAAVAISSQAGKPLLLKFFRGHW